MGSRYGGLKQLDVMTSENDTIIDFSIYDAIEAGFTKIVFIIRKSFEVEFKAVFDAKLKNKIEVIYVFQELDAIPNAYINKDRKKPWGTAHALLMVKDVVDKDFVVINADDYYGKGSFKKMAKQLQKKSKKNTRFYLGGYLLKNTISEFGTVSRGQCFLDDGAFLEKIIERTSIEKVNDILFYIDDDDNQVKIDENTIVSMNFWGFTSELFPFLEMQFETFLKENSTHPTKEFFIPSVIDLLIKNKKATVKVIKNKDKWLGVTYKEDKEFVAKEMAFLKENKEYPKNLW